MCDLLDASQTSSGLYIGRNLKYEHTKLTSYSRMNVRLAAQVHIHNYGTIRKVHLSHAQVLSKSVADTFSSLRTTSASLVDDTTETERFCRIFNKWFDCMNTRSIIEGHIKRNEDLHPYSSPDDERLQV